MNRAELLFSNNILINRTSIRARFHALRLDPGGPTSLKDAGCLSSYGPLIDMTAAGVFIHILHNDQGGWLT